MESGTSEEQRISEVSPAAREGETYMFHACEAAANAFLSASVARILPAKSRRMSFRSAGGSSSARTHL